MTTLDDMAPEEQVVHNVIPLKDKMPLLGFSDVHCKAKSSLTVTFVRCQSDFLHCSTAEDAAATQAVSRRDQAGNADFILLFSGFGSCGCAKEIRAAEAPRTRTSCLCFLKNVGNCGHIQEYWHN